MQENSMFVKIVLVVSLLAFLVLSVKYIVERPNSIFLFGLSGLISILYVVKIRQFNLRETPFLKVFMVVIAYFILTVGLNIQAYQIHFDHRIFSLLFLILGLTILFDIPDRKIDSESNKTFAQVLGVKWTIILSAICVLFYFLLKEFGLRSMGTAINAIWALIVLTFYIKLPKKVDSEFYLAFYGEGILGFIGMAPFIYDLIR